jgi:hypothetical protein
MMRPEVVYDYPTWLSGLAIVAFIVLASVVLQAVLHALLPVAFRTAHNESVAAILSIIGITYAVLLAFVAMLTWEGFNKARAATFEEAGAVAELRRLTDGLPPSMADSLRASLTDYVRDVVGVEWPAQTRGEVSEAAERWLRSLHAAIGTYRPDGPGQTDIEAEFLAELATLSAARQGRLMAVAPIVPPVVWAVMLAGGGLLMVFSSLLGARSYTLHLLMTAALSASGALVIVLIVSLDSPFRSDFRISPAAFSMQSALGGSP